MTAKNNGGRAFPGESVEQMGLHATRRVNNPGMTLRDWFAGQALAIAWDARDKGYYEGDDSDMARCAYQIADAMIAERSKQ